MSEQRPSRWESALGRLYSSCAWLLPRDIRADHRHDVAQAFQDGLVATRGRLGRRAWFTVHSLFNLLVAGLAGRLEARLERRRYAAVDGTVATHSVGGVEMMGYVWQDIRLAVRSSLRRPGFALTTVFITALGLGATTTIFSVVDHVMLRALPYPDAEQLVFFENGSHTIPRFRDWQDRLGAFETIAASWDEDFALTGSGTPEFVSGTMVTRGFLATLGARTVLGRMFTREEFVGNPSVAIISQSLWQQRFGSDPGILGTGIVIDGDPAVVVGVLSREFSEPVGVVERGIDVWFPLDVTEPELQSNRMFVLSVIGRLRGDVSLERAREELAVAAQELAASNPEVHGAAETGPREIPIVPLREAVVGDVAETLKLLLGAVLVMLLIACANVANLFLARGTTLDREVAVRSALGAGKGRIVSQLLTQSTVLSLTGGAAGVWLAHLAIGAFRALGPTDFPRMAELSVDARVLLVAFAASVLTGVLFGLAPALRGARTDISGVIKDANAGSTGGRERHRLRTALVVGEIAMTLVLLVGAGLLMNSFARLNSVDPGFETERLVMVPLYLGTYSGDERLRFASALQERALGLPGVTDATVALNAPFVRSGTSRCCWATFWLQSDDGREVEGLLLQDWVTPSFFSTLGASLRGRELLPSDAGAFPIPTVISEELASELFPGAEALGRTYQDDEDDEFAVVGVVSGLHYWGLDQGTERHMWLPHDPFANTGGTGSMVLLVRSSRDGGDLPAAIREMIWALEPNLPVEEVTTMRQRVALSTAAPRFQSLLFITFAVVAVLLAAAGIYGSTLYVVSQRRREFGIRMVLGARGGDVTDMVLRRSLGHALLGVALGILGARVLGRFLQAWLFGVDTTDIATISTVGVLLVLVTLFAAWLPVRGATSANPVDALRAE